MQMTTDDAAAKLNAAIEAERKKPLPLGLHFGLPFDKYLTDDGLGSSALKLLAKKPFRWWWRSSMNALRPPTEKDTKARKIGRAMHVIVLEGREAFDSIYLRGPDQDGLTSGKKGASTRAFNEEAAGQGRIGLNADQYDRLLIASAMIMKNPELSVAFTGGCPEVSFFWMEGHVRMKMRVDYLKVIKRGDRFIATIGDLKKCDDWKDIDFEEACYKAVDAYDYHVQAAHYLAGAAHIPDALKEGHVWNAGGQGPLIDRLALCSAAAWQWVFHNTVDEPETASMHISAGSQALVEGRDIIKRGIDNYRGNLARHGTDMWMQHRKVHEFEFERMPRRAHYGR